MTKIIVLVPVKNDAWILHRFLAVTSLFADHIIVNDQFSDDGSREIYKEYPKVIVFNNASEEYNEATRQIELIKKARELFPGKKIILTLDADEVLAANAMGSKGWDKLLHAPVGSVLYFEKPDLYGNTQKAIRYKANYPMGMVEDFSSTDKVFYLLRGFNSKGHKILDRSIDIDLKDLTEFTPLYLEDILFLHYAHTRLDIQRSKMRHYSVVEATLYGNSLKNILNRRFKYNPGFDYVDEGKLESAKQEWFEDWEQKGIDMHSSQQNEDLYWRDVEVLKLFSKYGTKYFRFENIWDTNWESKKQKALKNNVSITNYKIDKPNFFWRLTGKIMDVSFVLYRSIKNL